jgi:molybdenum cofactor cytidylyltransferase
LPLGAHPEGQNHGEKMKSSNKFSVVILAAGGSKRLGSPKQLVSFKGDTLLSRSIIKSSKLDALEVIVVIGAYPQKIKQHIACFNEIKLIINTDWLSGMSSSIKIAILSCSKESDAILFLTCDQPYINEQDLLEIIKLWKRDPTKQIGSFYNNIIGIPAIIPRKNWPKLKNLTADHGARHLLINDKDTLKINMPNAAFDVDTKEDLSCLS